MAPETLPELLQVRFQGLVDVIQAQLQPAAEAVVAGVGAAVDTDGESDAAPAPTIPSPEEIAAQVQLEATLARNAAEIARERELTAQRELEERQQRQQQAQGLEQLAHSLEAGDLATSRAHLAQLQPATFTGAALRHWQSLQPRLRELQGWQSWANNKVRTRLCGEIERLVGSGLHPDAISHRIGEIRDQWRQLDQLEGRDDDSPPTGLDRRLRAACARALKPAREFFDKRQSLRDELSQTVLAFLADSEKHPELIDGDVDAAQANADTGDAVVDNAADTANPTGQTGGQSAGQTADAQPAHRGRAEFAPVVRLMALQKAAIGHLRNLDPLAPHQRKRLAARLRGLLDAIKPRLEAAFADVEDARKTLIDAAGELIKESDGRQLARQARQLQERWQAIGMGRRSRDQQQWRQFRAAIDQAFSRLDQQRAEHEPELAVPVLGFGVGDQPLGHRVDGCRYAGELLGRSRLDPGSELAAGNRFRTIDQIRKRIEHAPPEQLCAEPREDRDVGDQQRSDIGDGVAGGEARREQQNARDCDKQRAREYYRERTDQLSSQGGEFSHSRRSLLA